MPIAAHQSHHFRVSTADIIGVGVRLPPQAHPAFDSVASVDEALALVGGMGRCQHLLVGWGFMLWAAHAVNTMSMVYALPPDFGEETAQLSRSLFFIGWMLGLFFWGPYAKRYGWKPAFVVAQVLSATFGCCSALAPNATVYMCARLCNGFAEGAIPTTSFSYVCEFLPPAHRARTARIAATHSSRKVSR